MIYLVDFWSKNLNLPGRANKNSKLTLAMINKNLSQK